jgi:hypothetical protein
VKPRPCLSHDSACLLRLALNEASASSRVRLAAVAVEESYRGIIASHGVSEKGQKVICEINSFVPWGKTTPMPTPGQFSPSLPFLPAKSERNTWTTAN